MKLTLRCYDISQSLTVTIYVHLYSSIEFLTDIVNPLGVFHNGQKWQYRAAGSDVQQVQLQTIIQNGFSPYLKIKVRGKTAALDILHFGV